MKNWKPSNNVASFHHQVAVTSRPDLNPADFSSKMHSSHSALGPCSIFDPATPSEQRIGWHLTGRESIRKYFREQRPPKHTHTSGVWVCECVTDIDHRGVNDTKDIVTPLGWKIQKASSCQRYCIDANLIVRNSFSARRRPAASKSNGQRQSVHCRSGHSSSATSDKHLTDDSIIPSINVTTQVNRQLISSIETYSFRYLITWSRGFGFFWSHGAIASFKV